MNCMRYYGLMGTKISARIEEILASIYFLSGLCVVKKN